MASGAPELRSASGPRPWALQLVTVAAAVAWLEVAAGRVPGWPEAVAALVVAGALTLAAVSPGARGFVPAVTRGPTQAPRVALTFDDGPDPLTTPRVLAALAAAGVHATFFLVGAKARREPALARRLRDEGHEVGAHGHEHRWTVMLTSARATRDLRDASDAIAASCGVRPTAVRPPYGVTTPAFAAAVRRLGLSVVGWSVRSFDTVRAGDPAALARRLAASARPGSIILLHDAPERTGGRTPMGPELVAPLVAELRARGLEPVTVAELLAGGPAGRGRSRPRSR